MRSTALFSFVICLSFACGPDEFDRPQQQGLFDSDGVQGGRDADSVLDSGVDGAPGRDTEQRDDGSTDNADSGGVTTAEWLNLCAGCHGEAGEGGVGPPVAGTALSYSTLVDAIDARMPPSDPSLCVGECADRMADYILSLGPVRPATCDRPGLAPQRLRLLTRTEYNATVSAMLYPEAAVARDCSADSECDWRSEVCTASVCAQPACGSVVFVLDGESASGADRVSVAGSFNDWVASGAGELPLTWDGEIGAWRRVVSVGAGAHRYKFVLNGGAQWIDDPGALESEDDGFGGRNSVLRVSCSQTGDVSVRDWAAEVPVETRPTGFYYPTHSASARVTTAHLEAYLSAAERIGAEVAGATQRLVGCDDPRQRGCLSSLAEYLANTLFRQRGSVDVDGLVTFALQTEGAHGGDPAAILATTMLMHPRFLYRSELGESVDEGVYRLSQAEIADLMAYSLTGSPPDEELLRAAEQGLLSDGEQRRTQARRLLGTAGARRQIRQFAASWLGIDALPSITRSLSLFPNFSAELAALMQAETERFVEHVVLEANGGVRELLTARYSFLDQTLAALYGVDSSGLAPGGLTRVELSGVEGGRAGLLGHASVLAATSHSDQTSPIRRGLFVRQRLLCQDFGIPPANAGGVPDVDPSATTRERFRQHTDDPSCFSCHQYIDDLGFGFERFDAIGAYRTTENGVLIDNEGNMNDVEGFGTSTDFAFTELHALGAYLAESEAMQTCFAHQYVRYVLGTDDARTEVCADEALRASWDPATDSIAGLVEGLVASDDFVLRWAPEGE